MTFAAAGATNTSLVRTLPTRARLQGAAAPVAEEEGDNGEQTGPPEEAAG